MSDYHEELAIMKHLQFGVRDRGSAALWFDVTILSGGALLSIPRDQVIEFIEKNDISDIKNLEGHPCVVETNGDIVRFKRLT